MLTRIKTMDDKKQEGLEYTRNDHSDSYLDSDPDFSSEGIISTEKKRLAIAQFRIAKHEQIIRKREEAMNKRKAAEEEEKQVPKKRKRKKN